MRKEAMTRVTPYLLDDPLPVEDEAEWDAESAPEGQETVRLGAPHVQGSVLKGDKRIASRESDGTKPVELGS